MQDISNSNLSKQAVRPVSEKICFLLSQSVCILNYVFDFYPFKISRFLKLFLSVFDWVWYNPVLFQGWKSSFYRSFYRIQMCRFFNECMQRAYVTSQKNVYFIFALFGLNFIFIVIESVYFPYFSADCIIMWWHPCTPNRYF